MQDFEKEWNSAVSRSDEQRIGKVAEAIYNQYVRLVFKVAYTILLNKEEAEDVTQDVFISFFNTREKALEVTNIKYYLLNSAKFISYKRKQKDETTIGFEEEKTNSNFELPIESLLFSNKNSSGKPLLNEEEANIIIKHLEYDFTFKEIGEELGQTTHAISGIYRRAIEKLRNFYKEEE